MKLGIVFSILFIISFPNLATAQPEQSVIEFDVPYELFAALSDYHDLTQLEKERYIDEEMIPVITEIIYYFTEERKKYLAVEAISAKVKTNLARMNAHLTDFKNELLFRQKVVEFRELLKKQQKLKSNQ